MTQSSRLKERRWVGALAGALYGVLAFIGAASAQIPGGLPGAVQPGRDRPPLSEPAKPNFDFHIETPGRSTVPRAVDEIRFHLKDIEIKGAVTISPARFRPYYQKLIGTEVSLSDILDVADAIENEYRRNGFILVRAFVPPQRVADGIFTINVVEGFIANVTVEGGDANTRERIRDYLQPARESRPLKLAAVEKALLLANDLPGISASGLLRPSPDTPGASDLVVTVPDTPVQGGIAIDNRGSRFSGIWSATLDGEFNSVLDGGDQLGISLTGTLGEEPLERSDAQLRYLHPVGDSGGLLSLIGTITHGEPASTLTAFNVLTDSWAVGPRFSWPLERTRAESIVFEGGITFQSADVNILGSPLSRDRWRVADFGVSYQQSGFLGGDWSGNLDIAQGLPILGASRNGETDLSRAGARMDFTKLSGGLRFTRPLWGAFSMVLAGQGQYAFDPLLVGEQFTFGGSQIGRGYDLGALTGDHGLGGSAEAHYDHHFTNPVLQALEPYIFFDTARVWDVGSTAPSQGIASVGGGLRAWLEYNAFADVEVAQTLEAVPGSDGGRRATKVLLNLSVRY